MKLFKITHKLGEPLKKEINLATDSTALVGINWVTENGVAYNPDEGSFKVNGEAPEIVELEGVAYTCFQISAGDATNVTDYAVTWTKTEAGALTGKNYGFAFKVVTTARDVAEVGGVGGGDFIPTEAEDETNAFEWTVGKTERWDNNTSSRQTLNGMDNVYFANEGDDYPTNASRVYSQEIFVTQQNPETGAIVKQSEMDAEGVRATMVDESDVVHTGELKHDGVYLNEDGYKPVTISVKDSEGNDIEFKCLGFDLTKYSPASWFTFSGLPSSTITGLTSEAASRTELYFPKKNEGIDIITIGSSAFLSNSKITHVEGKVITTIGSSAFQSCTSLTDATFPACTKIGNFAFSNCTSLTRTFFPSCASIGQYTFSLCTSLTEATFPACASIGASAFMQCTSLRTISFPVCTSLGNYAFRTCRSLTTASFPVCPSIGNGVFYSCSALTTASFPVCSGLGYEAFQYCSAMSMAYLPVCSSIGTNAFYGCSALTELNLSNSPMSVVTAMVNFPWGITNSACQIIGSDGWVDKDGNEHPNA